jgi:hypothetical protein
MTFEQAIAQQPAWVQYWLYWLVIGTFVLPLALLIWRQTRLAAIATLAASLCGGLGVTWLYGQMGYVKLLGLPHIIFWTPLVIYLVMQHRRGDLPQWPRWILSAVIATILVSLAVDYTDAARYLLGERTPLAMPT